MKLEWVYIAMYHAICELYDESPDHWEMELLAHSIATDPYRTLNHRPPGEKYLTSLIDYANEMGFEDTCPLDKSYGLVSNYLAAVYPEWGSRFLDITPEEWKTLCGMIEEQESHRVIDYVSWRGFDSRSVDVFESLIGKTLKSIEFKPEETPDEAWVKVRLNTGNKSVRLELYRFNLLEHGIVDFTCAEEGSLVPLVNGETRLHLIGERVTGVEVVRFAASIDGAPLEGKPEDGYDFERMPGQHMAVLVHTKEGVYSFYRRGCEDGTIHMGRSVPTDEELGIEEFRAFWSEGGHEVEVRRDVFEVE